MVATEDLVGHSTFYDRVSQILFGGAVELYADREKARVRVTSLDDPNRTDEIVFYVPNAVLAIHMIIAVFREVNGTVEEETLSRRTELSLCPTCSGQRFNIDEDWNVLVCPACEGEGVIWVETKELR